jgi:hypothetical protein
MAKDFDSVFVRGAIRWAYRRKIERCFGKQTAIWQDLVLTSTLPRNRRPNDSATGYS